MFVKTDKTCNFCKKNKKINEKGFCKRCQKSANNMKCGVCGTKLKMFFGNPNKKKDRMRNVCSTECAIEAGYPEEILNRYRLENDNKNDLRK